MLVLDELATRRLVDHEICFAAVREAFLEVTAGQSQSLPVLIGHSSNEEGRFTVKAGTAPNIIGIKIGSFWRNNGDRGLPRHSSTIVLLDPGTGVVAAVLQGGELNAYRTAAADAVAASVLARKESETLAVFGAGNQAFYEISALSRIRPIKDVKIVSRSPQNTQDLVSRLALVNIDARAAEPRSACEEADIIVTATPSTVPLFEAAWVKPGTHIASMGSDARGKQELPPQLFSKSRLFCDLPEQSRVIGEFQHALPGATVTAIGDVLSGKNSGRLHPAEVTIFDSSGLAAQDLYVARAVLKAHGAASSADGPQSP